ncbi:MAG: Class II abasic (AP) endonuclease [Piccolia ochrophora]|nr:MAG: Class II abasic (AP) endonuclease [Piccolia ochrophora]
MVLRITTWNVNGIRNPFSYQPWSDKRSFEAMFDILEADIVVFQETKIQRKDLRDDMVLVPGWDCFFSLPKHKKGYSGVAIYTRQSVCAPIRAEEGITGVLHSPASSISFRDLPQKQQIGGYPTQPQLARSNVDVTTLDSEGRAVLLEFPAFVLIGVYSPANRDESRDDFRLGFLNALDARMRNLVTQGKRIVLTGDLNISREDIDTANAEEQMRKHGLGDAEFISTPSRRLFNQLLVGGKVTGERDVGREVPIMWDICRGYNEGRKGMFTCWEQKINARPGNFGSRIDYVLCSAGIRDWFCESNIQEGLMGSDHCPVYAVIKDKVVLDNQEIDIRDISNPPDSFQKGARLRAWSTKDLLPLSGRLIPEFDRRRNIRDMFQRKLSNTGSKSDVATSSIAALPRSRVPEVDVATDDCTETLVTLTPTLADAKEKKHQDVQGAPNTNECSRGGSVGSNNNKRAVSDSFSSRPLKRSKSGATTPSKGQQSLRGFFKPRIAAQPTDRIENGLSPKEEQQSPTSPRTTATPLWESLSSPRGLREGASPGSPTQNRDTLAEQCAATDGAMESIDSSAAVVPQSLDPEAWVPEEVIDPIVAKESWTKLFSKRSPPRCEGHNEHCISLLTKKPGINCGRSFWMCPRFASTSTHSRNS